ncbi:MAG: hypothetical protein KJ579_00020, partial [Verrucomicrobia bacterium]|nr:hypothetical protein [Verrucomicrobiota bacterium]
MKTWYSRVTALAVLVLMAGSVAAQTKSSTSGRKALDGGRDEQVLIDREDDLYPNSSKGRGAVDAAGRGLSAAEAAAERKAIEDGRGRGISGPRRGDVLIDREDDMYPDSRSGRGAVGAAGRGQSAAEAAAERKAIEDGRGRGMSGPRKGEVLVDRQDDLYPDSRPPSPRGSGPNGEIRKGDIVYSRADGGEGGESDPKMGALGNRSPSGGKSSGLSTTVDPARQAAWEAAQAQAGQRVNDFDAAVKSGDPVRVRKAALNLQSDPIAVQKINHGRPDLVDANNRVTEGVKAQTRQNIKENMASEWNRANPDKPPISAKDVEIYEPTNYRDPAAKQRVGQDWDVTVRVNGKDVPPAKAQKVVNQSYFDAAGGESTFGKGTTPDQAAHKQSVETTHKGSAESYSEPEKILGKPGQKPDPHSKLNDPEALTHTIESKSDIARNKAADARTAGNDIEAVKQDFEDMRQAAKQYEKITKPRVEAKGGSVHSTVDEGMKILGQVGPDGLSPEAARAKLAAMGETPESIISKAAGQAEAADKLGGNR